MHLHQLFSLSSSNARTFGGLVLLASMLGATALAACSGPDSQAYVLGNPPGSSTGNVTGDGGITNDSGVKGDAASDGAKTPDAAVDAAPAPDPIFNAKAYAANLPATSALTHHMNNGVNTVPGRGVDCMGCHAAGGAGKAFLAAGTAVNKGGTATPDVEVWIQDTNNVKYKVNSDAQGNFWFIASANGAAATFATPAKAAARKGASFKKMTANINAPGCNGSNCHSPADNVLSYE